jgi:type IV pilus assembly protein PilM
VDRRRARVQGKSTVGLPAGVFKGSLSERNIHQGSQMRAYLQAALTSASFKGSEICVVIPDEAVRISFVSAETLPKTEEEQQTFLRWKLKKTVPFDVDTAQIAFQVVGSHPNASNGGKTPGYDVIVVLSPRNVVEEYETLLDALGIHAGFVIPSSLAALNLLKTPSDDVLFVKVLPDCVTTTVMQNKQIKFYRRVTDLSLYESVYPTVLYYQDKLGGTTLRQMVVCGSEARMRSPGQELQHKMGIPLVQLEPRNIEDLYKPALGAVHLLWAN